MGRLDTWVGESRYEAAAGEAAVRERFPSARIEAVDGTHHWRHIEAPETVTARINALLGS